MSKVKRDRARQARARLQEERRRQRARQRRRRLLLAGAAVVVALALIGAIIIVAVNDSDDATALTGVETYSVQSNHVNGTVNYPQTPPAGGPHNPVWLNCGIYDQPVPNENAVHSLEHGAVWITYRPDLSADQVAELREIVGGQTYLTLSPYPNLPDPVLASAWGKQLRLSGVEGPRLSAFIREYRQGPQTPEPGAPCTGGVGVPQ